MPRSASKRAPVVAEADDPIHEIELPRESGSHADVFAAVGLADLLDDGSGDLSIRIIGPYKQDRENDDRASAFTVQLSDARTAAELADVASRPGYKYLQLRKKGVKIPLPESVRIEDVLDYERERDAVNAVRKQEEAVYAAAKKS